MTKKTRSPRAKLLKLMSTVAWQGVTSWQDMRQEHQTEQIEQFFKWLQARISYLPEGSYTDDFVAYYIHNETFESNASNRTRDMNICRGALYTLHKWEREHERN